MKIKKYTKEYENLALLFSCGNVIIDRFLQDGSALDANRGITYVMLSDEEDYIVGYYNIENGRVDRMYTVGNLEYHTRNGYEHFETDMSIVVQESDIVCYKLYKCVDDIVA